LQLNGIILQKELLGIKSMRKPWKRLGTLGKIAFVKYAEKNMLRKQAGVNIAAIVAGKKHNEHGSISKKHALIAGILLLRLIGEKLAHMNVSGHSQHKASRARRLDRRKLPF